MERNQRLVEEMNDMIDFTNLPTRKKSYGGANGNKLCVIINNLIIEI